MIGSMRQVGFSFDIHKQRGKARLATLSTPHGALETPTFVAVGTQATVKGLTPEQTQATGTSVLFANTYHLYLRPGAPVVAEHGGVHRFMNWDKPIMTDSGGFQVFSLGAALEHGVGKIANIFPGEAGGALNEQKPRVGGGKSLVKVNEDSVAFRSHIDGSQHTFTPEKSIQIQRQLGADIILAFDECTSPLHDKAYTRKSAERTHRWAKRCVDYFEANGPVHDCAQSLYGIVQGGAFQDLRTESAQIIAGMSFDGIAIGGNLGKTKNDMHKVIEWSVAELPHNKPRHLLGIGEVPDIFEAVERGCDTFDCVSPTRNARNGGLLKRLDDDGKALPKFRLNLKNARFSQDTRPVDESCGCYTCQHYSRAYLRHLFKADEILAQSLASMHNLHFMAQLCNDIRRSLKENTFKDLKALWLQPDA